MPVRHNAKEKSPGTKSGSLARPHLGVDRIIPVVMEPRCRNPAMWPAGAVQGKSQGGFAAGLLLVCLIAPLRERSRQDSHNT